MASIDHIRNGIIDKLLSISNKNYLIALDHLVENSSSENDIIKLSKEQFLMLSLSDEDIKNERTISQDDLDKKDVEWLKGQ
jgi:hypothetical protein